MAWPQEFTSKCPKISSCMNKLIWIEFLGDSTKFVNFDDWAECAGENIYNTQNQSNLNKIIGNSKLSKYSIAL